MKIALGCTIALALAYSAIVTAALTRQQEGLSKFEEAWHADCFVKNQGKGTYWKMPSRYVCDDENGVTIATLLR